jgi:hypothetical protein
MGEVQAKSGQTTGNVPSSQTEAFSRAWANALEQSELTTAQRLRSTKGLALPMAETKPAAQGQTNDTSSTGVFANEKTDPLPLVLSLSAPQLPPPAPNNGGYVNRSSGSISAAGNEDPEDTPLSVPGELAFSAKIKSPEPELGSEAPISSSAAAKSASAQFLDAGTNTAVVVGKSELDVAPLSGSVSNNLVNAGGSAVSTKFVSPSPTETVEAAPPAPAPQPLKEIALQLPGARGVEVRLSEHAGEVRIDVRSGDAALTQDLRGNLHDLVAGLERKGFSAEVSPLPEQATTPSGRSADMGASKDQTPGGQGGAFDRQPQQRHRQHGQHPEATNSKAGTAAWTAQANSSFGKENQ